MSKFIYLATAAVVALVAVPPVHAQGPTEAGGAPEANSRTTSYNASFFAQFAPRTALDIARRVPGFQLDLGDTSARGFAGAAGNVVINGNRPSSKSETIEQTLSRIPADQVVRAEVGPGNLYGADYASKSQVLNLILAAGNRAVEGTATASARKFFTGGLVPNASVTTVLHAGPSIFNLSAGLGRTDTYERGPDELIIPFDGPVVERRLRTNHYYNRLPFVAASWISGNDPERSAHLNLRYERARNGVFQTNHVTPTFTPEHDDNLIQKYLEPAFEIGGDVSRPLAGGAIKLVGLLNRHTRDHEDSYIGGAPALGGFHQDQHAKQGETIGRLSWTRADLAGFSFEAGAEVAYNSLDNQLALSVVNSDGSVTPIDLPIDNAKVTEARGEGYVSVGRTLGPTIHVDGGLRYETSNLKVRGDAIADRSLHFWKPNIGIDWNDNGWHARASLRRTVAQLNFYDFISGAEVAAGRVNGGNADLVPQQTWESRFTIEHPLLKSGVAKLDLGYDRVNQLQDRILTDEGFDAPGNLGTGTRKFASLTLDTPLDTLGIHGGRLKFTGTLQDTRVTDPSTHEPRHWTDYWPKWDWSLDYRQDLGRFSYGANITDHAHYWMYRTDELDEFGFFRPYGAAFVEFRPNAATTITLDVDNALDTQALWYRTFYSPNRTNPEPFKFESRLRNSHANIGLTIKRTF